MHKLAILLWTFLVIAFILVGAAGLFVFSQPFERARAIADLLAKDGSLELFSTAFYHVARPPMLALAGLLLASAAGLLIWRSRSQQSIQALLGAAGKLPPRLARDGRAFAADLRSIRLERAETFLLALAVLLALAARVAFIMRPFGHDEAYTVSVFAASPLRESLSDYFLPNNHLFHTLLVHAAYLLFGYNPWGVRLPALLAGVLLVPALYLLARRLHGRAAALATAASAAALPELVDFGTNARGYTLVMLFATLLMILAIYLRRRANLVGWALFVLFATLGLYTIPVFFFPYTMVLLWLVLAALAGDTSRAEYGSRWGILFWLAGTGVVILALSLLLYTPVFLRDGIRAVVPPQVSHPLSLQLFLEEVRVRLLENGQALVSGLPAAASWLLAVGFGLSLLLPAGPDRAAPGAPQPARIPGRCLWQLAALAGTFGLVFLLRSPPWTRFISFLIPLALMWAAAGWTALLRLVQERVHLRGLENAFALLVLLVSLVGTGLRTAADPAAGFRAVGPDEQVALYLKALLHEQDLVVVGPPHDTIVWYYSRLHQVSMDHYKRELPFFRAFILVDPTDGQTLDSVLAERMPDTFFFDLKTARVIYQVSNLQVYELIPDPDLIRKEYHLQ